MFLNSLYFTSSLAILALLYMRPMLRRIKFRPVFIVLHIASFFLMSIGIKICIRFVFNITEDNHVIDILFSKFSNFATFHTRLYTCAAEFDFLTFETIEKLNYTWSEFSDKKWLWRFESWNPLKEPPEQAFNFLQLIIFSSMAVLIMRLKLLATPQLCAITSLCVSKSLLRSIYTRNSRIRWIVFTLLLAGMTFKGVDNIKEQWALRGEYSNPSQERLFQWINMSTHTDAVFAGSMAVMANVKLSTGRPIVNHPHYESEIVRNRTIAVYSMYSRKPLEEVFFCFEINGSWFLRLSTRHLYKWARKTPMYVLGYVRFRGPGKWG